MSKLIPIADLDITTGVTSFTVDNVFSSTYTNYKIVFSNVSCNSSNTRSDLRLLDSSGTEITSNYSYGFRVKDTAGNNATLYSSSDTEWQSVLTDVFSANGGLSGWINISQPYESVYTQIFSTSYSGDTTGRLVIYGGQLNATTSCRGFKYITVNSGQTFTSGKIRVFGYRES
jgi:hypothetical protein